MRVGDHREALDALGFDARTGMLSPELACRQCGGKLNADGARSAELHAGTYTGRCSGCVLGKGYIIETLPDGARLWSYPPRCPAWRRDRQQFWGYPDCAKCAGFGWVPDAGSGPSAVPSGWRVREFCVACYERLSIHGRRATRTLLLAVADGLELHQLRSEGTAFERMKAAIEAVMDVVLRPFLDVPHALYRPSTLALQDAERRLGTRRPKSVETLRQELVAALRVEAEEGRHAGVV